MPAFTPAACRIRFDLRLSPRTSAEEADRAVDMQLQTIAARHALDLSWRRLVTIPGTTTHPDNLIIRTAIEDGEPVAGRAHQAPPGISGPTDGNIPRAHGVPTAETRLPNMRRPPTHFHPALPHISPTEAARH